MEEDLYINEHLTVPGHELEVQASKSSGPGGQHVQKTSSKVILRWSILNSTALSDGMRALLLKRLEQKLTVLGELVMHVQTERSFWQNMRIARERLTLLLQSALRKRKPRIATKPHRGAVESRLRDKKHTGNRKQERKIYGD